MMLIKAICWPILITGLLGLGISFFAEAPFVIGVLFALVFFAIGSLLHWPEEKPGGIDNPELEAPHYPLRTLLISGSAFTFLIALIYYFPEVKNYGFV
jgi:hypothetical protein